MLRRFSSDTSARCHAKHSREARAALASRRPSGARARTGFCTGVPDSVFRPRYKYPVQKVSDLSRFLSLLPGYRLISTHRDSRGPSPLTHAQSFRYIRKKPGNPVKAKETSINRAFFVPGFCTGKQNWRSGTLLTTRYGQWCGSGRRHFNHDAGTF